VGTAFILCFPVLRLPASGNLFLPAIKNPYPEVLRGCVFDSGTRLVYVSWVIITVEEGGKLRI